MENKIIMYYDMDAFFASIEQRDNLNFKNKPIVVGRNIVSTASYEARKSKIKSAMTINDAYKLNKNIIVVKPRVNYYFSEGKKIQNYIKENYMNSKIVSVDEGYIDVTNLINQEISRNKTNKKVEINRIVEKFKGDIFENFKLTCSIGVGFNILSSKIASDFNKPNGKFIFYNVEEFHEKIINEQINIIPGIGKKTIEILNNLKIFTIYDMLKLDKKILIDIFSSKRGNALYNLVRGIESSRKKEIDNRKSISIEETFPFPIHNNLTIFSEFQKISKKLYKKISENLISPQTITLKIKYSDFKVLNRSKTFIEPILSENDIYNLSKELYFTFDKKMDIRLIGISLSNFGKNKERQLEFF